MKQPNSNGRPGLRRSNSSTSSTANSSTSSGFAMKQTSSHRSKNRKRRNGSKNGRTKPARGQLKRQDSLQLVAKFKGTADDLSNRDDTSNHGGTDDSCSSDHFEAVVKEVPSKSQSDDESNLRTINPPQREIVRRLARTSSDRELVRRQKSFRSNSKRNLMAQEDPKKSKKSVKFKVSSKTGKIKRKVQTFEKCEPSEIWWNQHEMMSFRQDCIDVVAFYQQDEDYMWALRVLYQYSQEQHSPKHHHSSKKKNRAKLLKSSSSAETAPEVVTDSSDDEMLQQHLFQHDQQQRQQNNEDALLHQQQQDSSIPEEPPITEDDIRKASQLFATNGLGAAARGLEMHIGQIADAFVAQHSETVVALSETGKASLNAIRKESRATSKASQEFAYAMGEFDAQEASTAHRDDDDGGDEEDEGKIE